MLTLSDAVDIIIRYSPDYQTILNRKTVKRDVLFQYLHDNNVSLTPPMTKLALIQKILEYWGTTRNDNQDCSAQSENANGSALSETTNMQNTEDEVKQMATKFAEWFYTMMNEDRSCTYLHTHILIYLYSLTRRVHYNAVTLRLENRKRQCLVNFCIKLRINNTLPACLSVCMFLSTIHMYSQVHD